MKTKTNTWNYILIWSFYLKLNNQQQRCCLFIWFCSRSTSNGIQKLLRLHIPSFQPSSQTSNPTLLGFKTMGQRFFLSLFFWWNFVKRKCVTIVVVIIVLLICQISFSEAFNTILTTVISNFFTFLLYSCFFFVYLPLTDIFLSLLLVSVCII